MSGYQFSDHDTLLGTLVSQHGPSHRVTDRVNAWQVGATLLIDMNETPFIQQQCSLIRRQAVGIRTASHRNDQFIELGPLIAVIVLVANVN
jgi:hypothetical protein